ncbi:MAG: hypothetical protein WCE64_07885, partial [Bacteroidales bacterium]
MKKNVTGNLSVLAVLLVLTAFCYPLEARITRIVITKTEPYMEGRQFGAAGTFLKISGQAYGEVDPDNSLNSIIQD